MTSLSPTQSTKFYWLSILQLFESCNVTRDLFHLRWASLLQLNLVVVTELSQLQKQINEKSIFTIGFTYFWLSIFSNKHLSPLFILSNDIGKK